MTTIAFRDGVLASDSKMSAGSEVFVGETKKIYRIVVEEQLSFIDRVVFRKEPEQIEYLIGAAGTIEDIKEYIQVLFFGEPRAKGTYECTVIAISQDGEGGYNIQKYEGSNESGFPVDAEYVAVGSGFEIALGAMHHGASAVEAVEAAIYHDNSSGGRIQTISFDEDE